MTSYDPFSYGQVPMGRKQAAQPASPDDMLFADTGASRPEPQADSSWALLKENVDNLLPGGGSSGGAGVTEFGRDILGESGKAAPPPRIRAAASPAQPAAARTASPAKPVVARKPRAAPSPLPAPAARAAAPRPAAPAPRQEAPAPARVTAAVARGPMPKALRRPISVTSVVMSLAVLAGGGAAAWWFHAMQHNTVMAAIAGVTTVVGAALAWVLARR